MLNAGCLIPMLRMLLWFPLLWITKYRGDRKTIVWCRRRLQYEKYCMQWWEGGGLNFNWWDFQNPEKRRRIKDFYDIKVPKVMAKRLGLQ